MGFNDLLKKLFGNKSQRDLKEIEPYIQKIKAISPELEKLSNDELRHRIDVVKQHIQDSVEPAMPVFWSKDPIIWKLWPRQNM